MAKADAEQRLNAKGLYIVEALTGHRQTGATREFKVRWQGYGPCVSACT